MWVLRALHTRTPITFRLLPGGVKTVGRARRTDFVLDRPLVSRVHCRLTASAAGALEIEDLNSTNGTFVNGQRITERRTLAAGDTIRVGRVEMTVESDAAEQTASNG